MSLMQNMALFLRSFSEIKQISLARLQEMIAISRGAIYAYSRGEGNPTFSTVEHIAYRLHVDPVFIAMGIYDLSSKDIYVLLWQTLRNVEEFPPEDRRKFMKLLMQEMIKLWDEP